MTALDSRTGSVVSKPNSVIQGDCVELMNQLPERSVDLVFADPPFNIGYEYDAYDDRLESDKYLEWSKSWMGAVKRVLKDHGAFWLAIGDEYAAELKVLATRELGFTCRNWVVWYYTFGVHCHGKFTRSHAHLFYFVVNPKKARFNDSAIRVPSARQLVYNDRRADARGRVPDDTWIIRPTPHDSWYLRPQDLPEGFSVGEDVWYVPRVCGTFRERQGFHGCQMPEQLLGRIIRACSSENDLVLDPFSGSGTTAAVAKKLKRNYLAFDLSNSYVLEGRQRLSRINRGDALEGTEAPTRSNRNSKPTPAASVRRTRVRGLSEYRKGVLEAFSRASHGFSSDRVLADPDLNEAFAEACGAVGLGGHRAAWNRELLVMRKSKLLTPTGPVTPTRLDTELISEIEFASEIALGVLRQRGGYSLDVVLCEPELAREFDRLAAELWPIENSDAVLYYRWAALGLRKRARHSRQAAAELGSVLRRAKFGRQIATSDLAASKVPAEPGAYRVANGQHLYIGTAGNLRDWVAACQGFGTFGKFSEFSSREEIRMAFQPLSDSATMVRRGAQSYLIGRSPPPWNYPELALEVNAA